MSRARKFGIVPYWWWHALMNRSIPWIYRPGPNIIEVCLIGRWWCVQHTRITWQRHRSEPDQWTRCCIVPSGLLLRTWWRDLLCKRARVLDIYWLEWAADLAICSFHCISGRVFVSRQVHVKVTRQEIQGKMLAYETNLIDLATLIRHDVIFVRYWLFMGGWWLLRQDLV